MSEESSRSILFLVALEVWTTAKRATGKGASHGQGTLFFHLHLDDCVVVRGGAIDLTDGVLLLDYPFLNGPEPAPPLAGCGADGTADALSCGSHRACSM